MNLENGISGTSIDSFKIRIPINKVEILSNELSGKRSFYNGDTGEEIENLKVFDESSNEWVSVNDYESEFKKRARSFRENGITTHFAIQRQQIGFKGGETVEYFIALITAKLLKGQYFEGITPQTLGLIYERLLEYRVADFSYTDFLLGEVTDCDFKFDLDYVESFSKLIQGLDMQTKASHRANMGSLPFDRKENKGIQWSRRETTKFKTAPYLKIYHKGIELKYNSNEFRDIYLKGVDVENRIRVETTIKNRKHFKALFGVEFLPTLENVISLTDEQKSKVFETAAKAHLKPSLVEHKIKDSSLKPIKHLILNLVDIAMQRGVDFETLKNNITSSLNTKAKSRLRKELDEIYNGYLKGSPQDEQTKAVAGFLKLLGF